MGWREAVGKPAVSNSEPYIQKVQNIQKVPAKGAFVPSVPFVSRNENEKTYPIPDPETQYAMDERQAIIAVDGDPEYPVEVKIDSPILGAVMDVFLWPDHATVDGVGYSNTELADLKSRRLPAADLQAVHEVKKYFGGDVIPSFKAAKIGAQVHLWKGW